MSHREHWQLSPNVEFLNHGSFGATPKRVLEKQRKLQDAMECEPIRFLAPERDLEPKLDQVRRRIAALVNCRVADLAFVRNATEGVNAVLSSFPLRAGDEVVITNHGYNACNNAVRRFCGKAGASVRVAEIPFPLTSSEQVLDAIERVMGSSTRLLVLDHVTSSTGLVFPVESVVGMAHGFSVRVLIDGAHAPGMLPLDLERIGADYYTANHHKWLCAPKASGFLHVKEAWQAEVQPSITSHAFNRKRPGRSKFIAQFDWCGTYDPTPLLTVPTAIDFLASLSADGIEGTMTSNRKLALAGRQLLSESLRIPLPAPDAMIGSLVTMPLPEPTSASQAVNLDALQRRLYEVYRFELPIYEGPIYEDIAQGTWLMRISLQAYNDIEQVAELCKILRVELGLQ